MHTAIGRNAPAGVNNGAKHSDLGSERATASVQKGVWRRAGSARKRTQLCASVAGTHSARRVIANIGCTGSDGSQITRGASLRSNRRRRVVHDPPRHSATALRRPRHRRSNDHDRDAERARARPLRLVRSRCAPAHARTHARTHAHLHALTRACARLLSLAPAASLGMDLHLARHRVRARCRLGAPHRATPRRAFARTAHLCAALVVRAHR